MLVNHMKVEMVNQKWYYGLELEKILMLIIMEVICKIRGVKRRIYEDISNQTFLRITQRNLLVYLLR